MQSNRVLGLGLKCVLLGLLILVSSGVLNVQTFAEVLDNADVTVMNDPNRRQQVEPTIAVHPRKPNIVVAGAQDLRLVAEGKNRWHGYYRSIDGGKTWSVSLLPGFPSDETPQGRNSQLKGFDGTSDPVLAFDRNGNVFYAGVAFKTDAYGNLDFGSLRAFVAKYVNDGADYSDVAVIKPEAADKPWIAVDTSGGPYDGNVYLAFVALDFDGSAAVLFTQSTNGGRTFSRPVKVPAEGGTFPGVSVDSSGTVFVSTMGRRTDPSTGRTVEFVQVSRLTSGGAVLAGTSIAADGVIRPPSPLPGNKFRTPTIPQIAADKKGVYVVWDDYRTGDSDILFVRSRDGGLTWSSPVRVNDATVNHQFFGSVSAAGGFVNVAFYDSRYDDGGTIESLDVFFAQSADLGESFLSNIRVTKQSFNPNLVPRTVDPGINSPFMGDYISIASTATSAHPIWTDNRNVALSASANTGLLDQDVFTATITFYSDAQGGGFSLPR